MNTGVSLYFICLFQIHVNTSWKTNKVPKNEDKQTGQSVNHNCPSIELADMPGASSSANIHSWTYRQFRLTFSLLQKLI